MGLSRLVLESRREVGQSWVTWPAESGCLPGLSDIPGEAMVKLYCPKCMDVYTPKSSRHHHTDGAYFGTGFPHMLFMVHPEYRPKRPANQFVPRWGAGTESPRVKRSAQDPPERKKDKTVASLVAILCAQLSARKFSEPQLKCGLSSWSIIFALV